MKYNKLSIFTSIATILVWVAVCQAIASIFLDFQNFYLSWLLALSPILVLFIIVGGAVSLHQIKRTGEKGKILSIFALISIFVIIAAVCGLGYIMVRLDNNS